MLLPAASLPAGVYNLPALTALDQLLDLAAKRGIKLTLILSRNWGAPDAKTNVRRSACPDALEVKCTGRLTSSPGKSHLHARECSRSSRFRCPSWSV